MIRTTAGLFRRHPGFAVASTLSIAAGMSLVIAVVGIARSILLQPLPFHDADRLAVVFIPGAATSLHPRGVVQEAQRTVPALDRAASYTHAPTIVGRSGSARTLTSATVSPEFFAVAGVRPILGGARPFDATAGDDGSVVVSHGLWTNDLGGDSSVVGRELIVAGRRRRISGITPPGFDFPARADVWLPAAAPAASAGFAAGAQPYFLLARLHPGATAADVAGQLAVMLDRLPRHTARRTSPAPQVNGLRDYLSSSVRDRIQLWLAVAVIVLILCGVNYATMSFARGMSRGHEIAIRRALGASAERVARELVTEAALCAILGGAVAVLLSWWLLRVGGAWLSSELASITPTIGWGMTIGSVIAAAFVGIAFAFLPAIEIARSDVRSVLQSGASASSGRARDLRSRKALVGLQLGMALTATALIAALIQADHRFNRMTVGVDYSRLITAAVFNAQEYPVPAGAVLDGITRVPQIEAAAAYGGCADATVSLAEQGSANPAVVACTVSPSFFTALGTRQLAGRYPAPAEIAGRADVVVVNRDIAARLFGSPQLAAGRRMRVSRSGWPAEVVVAGVIENVGEALIGFEPAVLRVREIEVHESAAIIARARGAPVDAVRPLASALATMSPGTTVTDLRIASESIERERIRSRGRAFFLVCVGVIAVALAIIGVFGLTAYATTLRAREFGIRLAVGASPRRLTWMVVSDLRWSAAVGLGAGLLASAWLTSWLDVMVRPAYMTVPLVTLPVTALGASVLALAVILAAGTGVPIRRVLRMDISRALHADRY